jgi:hypothetical protein
MVKQSADSTCTRRHVTERVGHKNCAYTELINLRRFGFHVSMLTTSLRMLFGDSTPSGEEGGVPAPTPNAASTILAQRAARQAASQPTPSAAAAAAT